LDALVFAFDSSTIDLCLNLFPWAKFRKNKGGIKMHTLLDIKGSIPVWIAITDALCHDVNMMDALPLEASAYYIMDRGYVDFERLYRFQSNGAFFVTRAKKNLQFKRLEGRKVDKELGLACDQTIVLTQRKSFEGYPARLRRISYRDSTTGKRFVFLTNNFQLDAIVIAQLYKERWKVELFFKWIKQHLRIKAFYGTSLNAVCTQIWVAVAVYVLIAIVRKELKTEKSLYAILQVLSISLFEKAPLFQILNETSEIKQSNEFCNKLTLFDL
jgi:IS4 transposase